MALVVPTGDPAWVRSSDLVSYGGDPRKHNHLGVGVVDGLTDVGAEEYSRMVGDLAACMRTVPFLTLTYTCSDTSPAAPTVSIASGMIGFWNTPYGGGSPPPGFPSLARNGDGDVTLTFASSYADPYGKAGAFVVQHPRGSICDLSSGSVVCQILTATTLRVKALNTLGAGLANAVVCVTVHSGS